MRTLQVTIEHALSPADAHARLDRAREKLESEYGATCTWENDALMRVVRKGLDAAVAIEVDRLIVDVKLGLLLTPLGGTIQDGISKRLTSLMNDPD